MPTKNHKRNFFLRIVFPTLLAFVLFTSSFFIFIIPAFESNMLSGKREMISELTNSAWSILDDFNSKIEEGQLTNEKAQYEAIERIKNLRYGEENKDYFWVTDENPIMIMHPYRPELDSTDLSEYSDPEGKKLFIEFVEVVKESGEGFVDYMWQWKDDSTKIVPKLSFVKEFKPWGWIIGTGIYIEDVKEEISNLTNNLMYVSLIILLSVGVILFYTGEQSFKIESERLAAEKGLRESEGKYKALVEASTDGLVMILQGEIVYANIALLQMLGYSQNLPSTELQKIICRKGFESATGIDFLNNLLQNGDFESQYESKLITKSDEEIDVVLYTSEITFGEKSGYTVIVKDISASKKISEELGENKERFNALINNVNVGVFRSTLGKNSKFIEANNAAQKIFGYEGSDEFFDLKIADLFSNKEEQDDFFKSLYEQSELKNSIIQIYKKDRSVSMISVSAVLVKDETGRNQYCDGIIEDITDKIKLDKERENLIVELQTSLKFLHQPLVNFVTNIVFCNINTTIIEAAKIITKYKYSACLVKTDEGEYVGIITDHDLRQRVVAENYDMSKPVFSVMSAPLVSIQSNAFVFEAFVKMHECSTRHLAVRNNEGKILGIISSEELLQVERQSSAYLIREIENAKSLESVSGIKDKLPQLIKMLVDSGAKTKNITHIITNIFDKIVTKLIGFAIKKLGEPPVKFSFVALGSAGRKEQALISDQDNAIIFENVDEAEFDKVKEYFDKLADYVCKGLNDCGYVFCKGEAMAMNIKWTQSLNKWIEYFHNWIANSSQQDLIDISIFFDFRSVYGDSNIVEELRKKLSKLTENQAGFFQHLTKNCLLHKPPVSILGGLQLESKGDHAETFDIKLATMPISDFARIYALKHSLVDTNTLERLNSLWQKGILTKTSYDEIVLSYNFLMQLRFRHQATQITKNKDFDNFIYPKELTQIEIKTLKNTFSQIVGIQKRLSYDFSGEAL